MIKHDEWEKNKATETDPDEKAAYGTENPGINMYVRDYHIQMTAHKDGGLTIRIDNPPEE